MDPQLTLDLEQRPTGALSGQAPSRNLSDLEFVGAEERLAACGALSSVQVWAPRPCRCVKPQPIGTADEDEVRCLNCGRAPS